MEIVPSIDLMNGCCVRLKRGDRKNYTIYGWDPLDYASKLEECGIKTIHVVNLDGAFGEKCTKNEEIITNLIKKSGLKVNVGGGIRSVEDADKYLSIGANAVVIGTASIENLDEVIKMKEKYGCEKIIIAPDVRNFKVVTNGWTKDTDTDVVDFCNQMICKGFYRFLVTDVDRDGMLLGPADDIYQELLVNLPLCTILYASGGIKNMDDIKNLDRAFINYAIVGKAIFEGRISFNELKSWTNRNC